MEVWIKCLDLPELVAVFGNREIAFAFKGRTLEDFFQALKIHYGPDFTRVLWDSQGKGDPSIQMIINGQFYGMEGRPMELKEGDRITFVVLLEGG